MSSQVATALRPSTAAATFFRKLRVWMCAIEITLEEFVKVDEDVRNLEILRQGPGRIFANVADSTEFAIGNAQSAGSRVEPADDIARPNDSNA